MNEFSSIVSICCSVDNISFADLLVGYSAITHDLEIALMQVLENKEKITKHTVVFTYHINSIYWVLGKIQLNFDKNTHNLITPNWNIYNSLKSETNTIQEHVKKEIRINYLFACPELKLNIKLIFTAASLELLIDEFKEKVLRNDYGHSALHCAAYDNPTSLKISVERFKEKVSEVKNEDGETALDIAAHDNSDSLQVLLDAFKEAIPEVKNEYDSTALHLKI